ncbi:MAG: sterol desaturase family protein [Bacteroidota bacterium]|jgi:sterol desaturase/sphingolipid hydroxylase (fatty acid hydroxylase superfamily)
MTIEILSPAVVVFSALVLILLERRFPYTEGQPLFRRGFWLDLSMYAIFQSYILSWVIFGFIHWLDRQTGMSQFQIISHWPLLLQFLLFFVSHDLYIYLFHKWQHRNKFLYRIHEAHHSVADVDWLAGARSHSFEIVINQTIEFLPVILLGALPEVALLKGIVDAVWGMYIHSNIDVRSGRMQYVINGPEMHRWHHSKGKGNSINFATKLAVWDWIFGTAYLPRADKPASYGLSSSNFPNGYFSQHWFAFRRFKKSRES